MQGIQSLSGYGQGFFDFIFAAFTFLAEEGFLLIAVFAIYWCVSKRLGEALLLSLFLSLSANGFLKDLVRRPRPFHTPGWQGLRYVTIENPLVNTVSIADSFSFPSGHSQCAGSFFTVLALWLRKKRAIAVAVVLILGVMASRVYLGVHFPADVLVGAALGIGSSLLCWWLFDKFYEKRLWLFGGVVLLLLPVLFIAPSPDTVKTFGVGVGAVVGLVWEQRSIQFTTGGTIPKRLLRLVVGGVLVVVLRLGLKAVLPHQLVFDGLRYAAMGLAATGIAPWVFGKLRLY